MIACSSRKFHHGRTTQVKLAYLLMLAVLNCIYNSVVHCIFTGLCNRYYHLIPEHFLHPEKKPCTHLTASPWQPLIYFLPLWLYLFWTIHMNGAM